MIKMVAKVPALPVAQEKCLVMGAMARFRAVLELIRWRMRILMMVSRVGYMLWSIVPMGGG
jgi:hypothetical protein